MPLEAVTGPWRLPRRPWTMIQVWNDLLFAHWPVPPGTLRPLVPDALQLDTFDGEAWVGIVPFRVARSRPRALPPIPGMASFPELNLRTYVTLNGKPGVYFFSLDAASLLAVIGARVGFQLPYFYARMACARRDGEVIFASRRRLPGPKPAVFAARYAPEGSPFEPVPGTLDHWLAERYCLYTIVAGRPFRADIHHRPWSLQRAGGEITHNTLAAAHGITLPDRPPLLHFAREQPTLIWWLAPA